MTAATEELAGMAQNLQEMVSTFKVSGSSGKLTDVTAEVIARKRKKAA